MWQTILSFLKLAFTFTEKMQQIDATLKIHTGQIGELLTNQARLHYEAQLQREQDARERARETYERRNEMLERENQQLRERLERVEKLLPPAPADKSSDEE